MTHNKDIRPPMHCRHDWVYGQFGKERPFRECTLCHKTETC